jgi:hypothetical protein
VTNPNKKKQNESWADGLCVSVHRYCIWILVFVNEQHRVRFSLHSREQLFDVNSVKFRMYVCRAIVWLCIIPRARLIIQRTKNLGLLAYLILMKYPTKKFF